MKWVSHMVVMSVLSAGAASAAETGVKDVVFAVHGGTGMDKQDMTPELDKAYRDGLRDALRAGYAVLQKENANGLDAVEAAIRVMENSPYFNAGKGAVFTHEGRNELDASIMEGKTKKAGAVAAVTIVKNPITAARAVMERSKHVMLIGRGAEVFATKQGLEIVDPAYFWTEMRWKQIQKVWEKSKDSGSLDKPGQGLPRKQELGTVGAVALDKGGNLFAGTSTGGMTDKQFGRVGDSPIIGAGTYADNEGCAVSATGHGEYFIRYAVAHEINSLVKYKGLSVEQAADLVINKTLKNAGGEGGVISLDPKGNFVMAYNSEGLYRGYVTRDGKITVHLYED